MRPWQLNYHDWPQFGVCRHVILSVAVGPISMDPYWVYHEDFTQWIRDHYGGSEVQVDLTRAGQIRFSTRAAAMHFKLAWSGR